MPPLQTSTWPLFAQHIAHSKLGHVQPLQLPSQVLPGSVVQPEVSNTQTTGSQPSAPPTKPWAAQLDPLRLPPSHSSPGSMIPLPHGSPLVGSPSPVEGSPSPSPVEGSPSPVEGSPSPVEGSPSPVEGSPSPVEGSPSPSSVSLLVWVVGAVPPKIDSSRPSSPQASTNRSTEESTSVRRSMRVTESVVAAALGPETRPRCRPRSRS